jgi:hypothetical protein
MRHAIQIVVRVSPSATREEGTKYGNAVEVTAENEVAQALAQTALAAAIKALTLRQLPAQPLGTKPESITVVDGHLATFKHGGFGDALAVLEQGGVVERLGWNGRGMWLRLQTPGTISMMTLPYIYLRTVDGDLVPWSPSQTDLLAHDWAGYLPVDE